MEERLPLAGRASRSIEGHHWIYLIDEAGMTVWSTKAIHDEAAILDVRLSTGKRAQVVGCLVESMSIRATVRVTGAAKNTIVKLLADLGAACAEYQDGALTNLPCVRTPLGIQPAQSWFTCSGVRSGGQADQLVGHSGGDRGRQ